MSFRSLLGPLLVLWLPSCSGGAGVPAERTVDLGTHTLHAVVAGDGSPTVVIDGGIGARSDEYRGLLDRLSVSTTVAIYDRAGYGSSGGGPLPRDSGREAEELHALLLGLAVPRPYVLVGHSLGGLNVQVYADRFPDEVAGLVLLDPPPLGWLAGEGYSELLQTARRMTDEWQTIADAGDSAEADFFRMLASEHREMTGASARMAAGIESFGGLPLVVVASGVPNPLFGEDAEGFQQYWISESRALSAKSSRGRFVLAEDSTHRLHVDAADVVSEAVSSVVAAARGG